MNVNDVMEQAAEQIPLLDQQGVESLLSRRLSSYSGFAILEQRNGGIIRPELALSSQQGQEAARVLVLRVIEEALEASKSMNSDHVKEELIDAINYLWSLACFPDVPKGEVIRVLYGMFSSTDWDVGQREINFERFLVYLVDPFLQRLRNRAWQNNPQSLYFDGLQPLYDLISSGTRVFLYAFESWEEFATFFIAKDMVLKFRLETGY